MNGDAIETAWQGPPQCENCSIRHLVLFADLQREDFALIHEPIDELTFGEGELLYNAGDAPNHVFTVREGLVKLVQYLPDGGQRIVRLLKQGDVAGLEALLGQPYQHNAVVLERVLVCGIPVHVVERLSQHIPRLHRQLITRWQRAVSTADAWLTELATGPAQVRVARLLLRLDACTPGESCYLPSREDIGAMLGVTTETASRIVAEFKRAGYIKESGPHRVGVDDKALRRIAE